MCVICLLPWLVLYLINSLIHRALIPRTPATGLYFCTASRLNLGQHIWSGFHFTENSLSLKGHLLWACLLFTMLCYLLFISEFCFLFLLLDVWICIIGFSLPVSQFFFSMTSYLTIWRSFQYSFFFTEGRLLSLLAHLFISEELVNGGNWTQHLWIRCMIIHLYSTLKMAFPHI